MSKLVNRIAAVAALALAATPIIGLTAAHAADRAQPPIARIKVGDLALSNPADAREFARRANVAANRACKAKGFRGLSTQACVMDFNEELRDALSERQVTDLKLARRAGADINLALN